MLWGGLSVSSVICQSLLLAGVVLSLPGDQGARVQTCKEVERRAWRRPVKQGTRCSVHIIDLAELAVQHGIPGCREDDYVTELHESKILPDPRNTGFEIPLKTRPEHELAYPYEFGPHHVAQSSGPWHFVQSLKRENFITSDISRAAVVYVYDYCYFIWGLAEGHADYHWWFKRNNHSANNQVIVHMLQLYKLISEMPKFTADNGRRFVFWQPHVSAFGEDRFWDMKRVEAFKEFSCATFQKSLYLVPSLYQRWRCMRYQPARVLVVPSASTSIIGSPPLLTPRKHFLFYKVTCEQPQNFFSQGKKFRADLAMALLASNASDMIVQCNVGALGDPNYNKISHRQLMQYLSDTVFCPALPGDDQSSQHLTEQYLMGCIPVFVGPPYHAMPFEKEIDYGSSAVFINVTNSSAWLSDVVMQWSYPAIPEDGPLWQLDLEPYQRFAESPKWWSPVTMSKALLGSVDDLQGVLPYLRSIPESKIRSLQAAVLYEKAKFIYKMQVDGVPAANQILLDNMCHFVGKGCAKGRPTPRKKRKRKKETAHLPTKVLSIPTDPELTVYAPIEA